MVKKIYLFYYIGNAEQKKGVSDDVLKTAISCEGYILMFDEYVETRLSSLFAAFTMAKKYINPENPEIEYDAKKLTKPQLELIERALEEQRPEYRDYSFNLESISQNIILKLKEKIG